VKKKMDLIKELGEKFIKQAQENGYSNELLQELWSQMETFGRYGLRKC